MLQPGDTYVIDGDCTSRTCMNGTVIEHHVACQPCDVSNQSQHSVIEIQVHRFQKITG